MKTPTPIIIPKESPIIQEAKVCESTWIKIGRFRKVVLIPFLQNRWIKIFKCHYCEECFMEKDITKDHKDPQSKGGEDVPENVVPACLECNREKADKSYSEYMRIVRARKKIKLQKLKNLELKKQKDEKNISNNPNNNSNDGMRNKGGKQTNPTHRPTN
jgi:5-methylcytosine-specific restriction endonuclease McrA